MYRERVEGMRLNRKMLLVALAACLIYNASAVLPLGPPAGSAAGVWAFTLTDTGTRYLTATLFQSGDAISGYGELNESNVKTPVMVGGTVLGDRIAISVTPAGGQSIYRLSLTSRPGSTMDGNYVFSTQGLEQPGVVFGTLVTKQTSVSQSITDMPKQNESLMIIRRDAIPSSSAQRDNSQSQTSNDVF